MPPQLRQLNVSYNSAEDRLLLKVSTSDDAEYRAWCTRRFTRLLMDKLEDLFEEEVSDVSAVPEEARRDVVQMQHSQKVTEESFQRSYEAEPSEYPLGEEGVLVTTLKYKHLDEDVIQMHLGDSEGKGVALRLTRSFRHQLYELFKRAADKASWFEAQGSSAGTIVH